MALIMCACICAALWWLTASVAAWIVMLQSTQSRSLSSVYPSSLKQLAGLACLRSQAIGPFAYSSTLNSLSSTSQLTRRSELARMLAIWTESAKQPRNQGWQSVANQTLLLHVH